VRFLCKFHEEATALLEGEGPELSPQIRLFIPLLKKILARMRVFEADDAPLACLTPEIADLSSYLERHAHRPSCAEVSDIYHDTIPMIRRKCLSTTNSISRLACVLTPARRILARDTLLQGTVTEVESPDLAEAEFDEDIACDGLVSLHDPPPLKDDGQHILEAEEEDGEKITPERMFKADIYADQDTAYSQCPVHLEAEAGLREILDQFRLSATEIDGGHRQLSDFYRCRSHGSVFEPSSQKQPIYMGDIA
jgi:hypothetical protein